MKRKTTAVSIGKHFFTFFCPDCPALDSIPSPVSGVIADETTAVNFRHGEPFVSGKEYKKSLWGRKQSEKEKEKTAVCFLFPSIEGGSPISFRASNDSHITGKLKRLFTDAEYYLIALAHSSNNKRTSLMI